MTNIAIDKSFHLLFWDADRFRNFLKSIKLPYRVDELTYTEENYLLYIEFIVSISGTSPAAIKQLMESIAEWR